MSLVARLAVPGDAVPFVTASTGSPIDLTGTVPDDEVGVHYLWVPADVADIVMAPSDLPLDDVRLIDDPTSGRLYRGTCPGDPLTDVLLDDGTETLYGRSRGDRWELGVEFVYERNLLDFHQKCVQRSDLAVDIVDVFDPGQSTMFPPDLTDRQREALLTAYENGYFDVPRRTTLVELSETLGVSDQAVSERLRRAESKLVQTHVLSNTVAPDVQNSFQGGPED